MRRGWRLCGVARWTVLALAVALLAFACTGGNTTSQAPSQDVVKYDPALPLLLEYGRPSCPYCVQMRPILNDLAARYRGRLNVSAVNIDEQPALAERAGVRLLPTVIIYRPGGQEIFRHVGFWPQEKVVVKLSQLGLAG